MSLKKAHIHYQGVDYPVLALEQEEFFRLAAQFDTKFPQRFTDLLSIENESQLPQGFDVDHLIKAALHSDPSHARKQIFEQITGIPLTAELEKFMTAQRFGKQTIVQLLDKAPVESINFCVLGAIEQHYENFKNQIFAQYDIYKNELGYGAEEDITVSEFAHICQLDRLTAADVADVGYGSLMTRLSDAGMSLEEQLSAINKIALALINIFIAFRAAATDQPIFALATGNLDSGKYKEQWAPITEAVKQQQTLGKDVYNPNTFQKFSKDSLLQYCKLDSLNYPFSINKMWNVQDSEEYYLLPNDAKVDLLSKIRGIIQTYYPDGKGLQNIIFAEKLSDLNSIWERQLYYFYNNICKRQNQIFGDILKDSLSASKKLGGDRDDKTTEELLQALPKGRKYPDQEYDAVFNFNFDSKDEHAIVNKFRNEFNIQCVPSNIEIPCVDESPNELKFKIDFVLYCDVLDWKRANFGETEVITPVVKPQVILVGEYFGGCTGSRPELKRTLLNIDGSVYEKNGKQYLKGMQNVPEPDIYHVRTAYKKMTESFAAKSVGSATISIENTDDNKAIVKELDHNNVIYVPSSEVMSLLTDTSALKTVIAWYNNQTSVVQKLIKTAAGTLNLDKYLSFANGKAEPQTEKVTKYDRYLSLIAHEMERVKFKAFEGAVKDTKKLNYNRSALYPIYQQKQQLENQMHVVKANMHKAMVAGDMETAQRYVIQLNVFKKQYDRLYDSNPEQKQVVNLFLQKLDWKFVQLTNLYNQIKDQLANNQPIDPVYIKMYIEYCKSDTPQKLSEYIASYKMASAVKRDILIRLCQIANELDEAAPEQAGQLDKVINEMAPEGPMPPEVEPNAIRQPEQVKTPATGPTEPQMEASSTMSLSYPEAVSMATQRIEQQLRAMHINFEKTDDLVHYQLIMDQITAYLN